MPKPTLSKREYVQSMDLATRGYDFYGLLAATMRQADTVNLALLRAAFPGIWESLIEWTGKRMWPLGTVQ